MFRRYGLLLDKADESEEDPQMQKKYTKVAFAHFLVLKHHAKFPPFEIDEEKYMVIKPSGTIEAHSLLDEDTDPPLFKSRRP